ncbi:MAG: hypothetical protein HYR64_04095 [Fimbriimonas ginsengisoli]|uniref:Uncharacterized protein n=1 Tax=Fimbriimonas ginsengisoli TaxID=1005039 RepID=A0A931LRX2_FIMGI|nr:hypothetical protein [Fimbriimonas ginsengisoli]
MGLRGRSALEVARSMATRVLLGVRDRRENVAVASMPPVEERQTELIVFYGHYEELIETLCDAAQLGPSANLEREYQRLRTWIKDNYPNLRRFVVAFLRYSAEDAEQGLAFGASADAFEALVAPPTVEAFLRSDDGGMISRIQRTREALMLYGEHLRHLAAKA